MPVRAFLPPRLNGKRIVLRLCAWTALALLAGFLISSYVEEAEKRIIIAFNERLFGRQLVGECSQPDNRFHPVALALTVRPQVLKILNGEAVSEADAKAVIDVAHPIQGKPAVAQEGRYPILPDQRRQDS